MITLSATDAFTASRRKSSSTKVHAWSIPTDMSSWNAASMFNSGQLLPNLDITSSWYTVSNPSRGKRVYEDVAAYDYTLISAGIDWPTYESIATRAATVEQQQRQDRMGPLGPIRKAARWVRRQK